MPDAKKHPYLKGKVVYQIYPRSFYDANGDGIGDIQGIIQKLDYLNDGTPDSLGINMIWLSPFYPSPMADFGYDISDYTDIDPVYGSLDDFRELVRQAHDRGIRLMIDFVPNHTSRQHPWFLESAATTNNPKRDFYIWRDGHLDGSVPNNWLSVFGGSAWELDETTGQYYLHSFLSEQPDLNWANPDVRAAMCRALRFWMELGVDGIRVDAVDWMAKDELFRDNPQNPHYAAGVDDPYHEFERRYNQNAPELYGYLRDLAAVVRQYPRGFMVTETYPDRHNVIDAYISLYNRYLSEVSAPFNFEGILLPWHAISFKTFVDTFQSRLKPGHVPIYVLGNHDNSRLASRIGPAAARTAAMMLLTLPGIAFIYYGEELGMTDVHIPPDLIQDPFEKRVPGLGLGRDPERTPMQWTSQRHAGFSRNKPWLPVAPTYTIQNAKTLSHDYTSIYHLYRKLIQLRNTSPILQYGAYVPLDTDCPYVFGFRRHLDGHDIAVLLNFTDQPVEVHTGLGRAALMYSTHGDTEGLPADLRSQRLRPNEGQVLAVL